jgi:hypothetical protein
LGIRFEQFEHEIQILDSKLKPGGLLIIDHADFSFADTQCGHAYDSLPFEGNFATRARPLFDRNNKKISDEQHIFRAFVKRSTAPTEYLTLG